MLKKITPSHRIKCCLYDRKSRIAIGQRMKPITMLAMKNQNIELLLPALAGICAPNTVLIIPASMSPVKYPTATRMLRHVIPNRERNRFMYYSLINNIQAENIRLPHHWGSLDLSDWTGGLNASPPKIFGSIHVMDQIVSMNVNQSFPCWMDNIPEQVLGISCSSLLLPENVHQVRLGKHT